MARLPRRVAVTDTRSEGRSAAHGRARNVTNRSGAVDGAGLVKRAGRLLLL